MKTIMCNRIFLISVVSLVFCESAPILAANGDMQWFDIDLRNDEGYEGTTSKFYQEYEDTSPDKCWGNKWWCCRTSAWLQKIPHWHTDGCTDLSSQYKEWANNWIEAHRYYCFSTNRSESATIHNSCHSWAMDFSAHIAAPSMVFEYDYTEISEWEAYSGCLCEHSGNHTSVVYSVNPCGYVAEIESKMGFYGVYVTGTEIYSGVSTYWDEE